MLYTLPVDILVMQKLISSIQISSCNAQDIRGNPSQLSVIAGNATAETVGELLLPLCVWLHVDYVLEQGDHTSDVHFPTF